MEKLFKGRHYSREDINQGNTVVLKASKSAGAKAKGDVPKICGFVHLLHLC
jgi:hypothetical protein